MPCRRGPRRSENGFRGDADVDPPAILELDLTPCPLNVFEVWAAGDRPAGCNELVGTPARGQRLSDPLLCVQRAADDDVVGRLDRDEHFVLAIAAHEFREPKQRHRTGNGTRELPLLVQDRCHEWKHPRTAQVTEQ